MSLQEAEQKSPETTEQVRGRILKLVEETSFGTPEYQAISDYLRLKSLYNALRIEHSNLLTAEDASKKLSWESESRITEMKIALLEHKIDQDSASVRGYGKINTEMVSLFENDLAEAVNLEAEAKHINEDNMQSRFAQSRYDDVFGDAQNAIYVKQE